MAEDDFRHLVESLPVTTLRVRDVPNILYHNGPIPKPVPEPRSAPIIQPMEGQEDAPKPPLDIRPGATLEITSRTFGDNYQTPAGLLIRKGRTNRLTVFSYYPGDHALMIPGTNRFASHVERSIKNTRIGLATLDDIIPVCKEANVVNGIKVRTLVHSENLGMRETYIVHLPGAGAPSLLYRFGKRFEIARDANWPNSARVSREQSAYLTNDSTVFSDLRQQLSICGAIILRYQKRMEPGQTTPLGEACGMINSAYLPRSTYRFLPHEYVVWADDFDGLLEEGWDIP
ncbi:hypothetical protein N0V84_003243 [Fusarium piperis]|uniref:Uncharacterized protein n=1 Tax=Fusarium piperis TaxID=1435070 RepID=A0A9W9BRJ4_9HYPO|nr:hypothetical protein N0V84_003243 [Fusarium piperis]